MQIKMLSDLVTEYYQRIDAKDVDWVLSLFADDAVYDRADASYKGHGAITEFYRGERKIVGKHSLDIVFGEDNVVFVTGVFSGFGHDGSPRDIGFSDVWAFNSSRLVVSRKTYLALGNAYVKE